MKIKHLLFGFMLSLNIVAIAQNTPKEVLFTIDQKPYYTDEFLRVYNKNLDLVKDESQKDLNQYLDLFVGYKLKINKAYKLGLQDGAQYQGELSTYRTQLSKNYLTDSKVTSELVQEAYNRSIKEILASHILILVDENAKPEDTLKAYKQVLDIRQKAMSGQDFGELAIAHSQDPSAKENRGDLGYFTAFRMVYPFESAAFNTPKGSISKPIRTRFGYHLIKVNDVRDNRGEVTVAHIMVLNPQGQEAAGKENPQSTIFDIYKKLQQGENFESLAKQFSEDKSSSSKGGLLNRFGSGQLSSQEFEDIAFKLTKDKPLSEPFQSQFGWHIVKLIDKHPIKPFADMRAELENKVSKDERSRLIAAAMNEKLRKQFPIQRDSKTYAAASKLITDKIYEGEWEQPEGKSIDAKLLSIKDKTVSGNAFLSYVHSQQKAGLTVKPLNKQIDALYESFVDNQLNAYYDENLEKQFPEFSAIMDEYRDGLLLFDLMEKEIWEKSKTDTIGLKNFFNANSSKYRWSNRIDATVVSSTKQDVIKKAQKLLRKNTTPEKIRAQLNSAETVNVMASSGVFEEGSDAIPKNLKLATGVTDVIKEGDYYFVIKINKVLPAGTKTLEEAKGRAINDYQQYLEENWVTDLKKEFSVSVNTEVFEKLKMKMQP